MGPCALFIDTENWSGFDLGTVISSMEGNIPGFALNDCAVRRAYGDWEGDHASGVAERLHDLSVKQVHVEGAHGREADIADVALTVDALELARKLTGQWHFILATGDGGMAPLARKLRMLGHPTYGVGAESRASDFLRSAVDRYLVLTRASSRRPPGPATAVTVADVFEADSNDPIDRWREAVHRTAETCLTHANAWQVNLGSFLQELQARTVSQVDNPARGNQPEATIAWALTGTQWAVRRVEGLGPLLVTMAEVVPDLEMIAPVRPRPGDRPDDIEPPRFLGRSASSPPRSSGTDSATDYDRLMALGAKTKRVVCHGSPADAV